MRFPAFLAVSAALALHAFAQSRAERDSLPQAARRAGAAAPGNVQTPAGEAPGQWLLGTIGVGKGADAKTPKETALKGLAIKLWPNGEAAVAYDLDLCRMVGAWTGKFTTPMNLMSRGEYPTALGEVVFTTDAVPGFLGKDEAASGAWKDPRPDPFGPLPPGHARFKGFSVNGDKTILKWDIAGTEVLEMPGYETEGNAAFFVRRFDVAGELPKPNGALTIPIAAFDGIEAGSGSSDFQHSIHLRNEREIVHARFRGESIGRIVFADGMLSLKLPRPRARTQFSIDVWRGAGSGDEFLTRANHAGEAMTWRKPLDVDLRKLLEGSPARWPEPVVTQGEFAKDTAAAYVVDTIKLPDPNPWGAPMFTSGFDFFDDGRAAVCTFHGDVFVVDFDWGTGFQPVGPAGVPPADAPTAGKMPAGATAGTTVPQTRWRRFASGLYHPLGLKVVKGEIFVACRDGLWRLNDINKDGECDFYELFNGDLKVTKNFHEFVFDLQTDAAGNFYFAKAGPVKNGGRGFDQIMSQHGTLMRVSPDGAKLDVIATGFRAPNGIGIGPRGELTSGDNEGTWTPACKINWIKPGGFYGVVDLAHRNPAPTDYDRPLCWLPKRIDNSGGSQVWAPPGARWGPWGGKMLHLSYGQSSLYGVLMEECGMRNAERGVQEPAPAAANSAIRNPQSALVQGGVVKFPLQFQSGIMRARFNPRDGQLYVMGLRGWQTNGLKNGCFQRVRFTGAVPRMPIEMRVKKGGIELRFACSLDTQTAADPQNWNIEQWRYVWSAAYGSPELPTEGGDAKPGELSKDRRAEFTSAQAAEKKHDAVPVKSVSIGTDDRTVFLEIPGLKPVMQMAIKYDLKTADGAELRGEVVNTIHALGAE